MQEHRNTSVIKDVLCEFIEIAFHGILYARKQYPETIFERKRKYGVVVYQVVHPDVNKYIVQCVKAINFHLKKNQLKDIFLCFTSQGKILEKYNFKLLDYISNFSESDPFLVKLEQHLREFCIKLHSSVSCLKSLPHDAIFSIQLHVTEYSNLEFNQELLNEDFPWISLNHIDNNMLSSDIIPIHTIQTSFLNLQMYIERHFSLD